MTMLWVFLLEVVEHLIFAFIHLLATHDWARPCISVSSPWRGCYCSVSACPCLCGIAAGNLESRIGMEELLDGPVNMAYY